MKRTVLRTLVWIAWLSQVGLAQTSRSASGVLKESFQGREVLVYSPKALPPPGSRALVVVLHSGLGNAARIEGGSAESGLKMDAVAQKNGFLVAYLNGTPVTQRFGRDLLGWNAGGGCCGVPAQNGVDDAGYIAATVHHLIEEYRVDPSRVYGIGHSNGAMMTLRLMCETRLYAAAVSVSGPLNLPASSCPAAHGRRILSIHGAEDRNVPIGGGQGSEGLSQVAYASEQATERIFTASGAEFRLQVVPGADHKLDVIDAKLKQAERYSLAEKAALFFGLAQ